MRGSGVTKICNSVFSNYWVIALYLHFFEKVCPDHISETIGAIVMKLHNNADRAYWEEKLMQWSRCVILHIVIS